MDMKGPPPPSPQRKRIQKFCRQCHVVPIGYYHYKDFFSDPYCYKCRVELRKIQSEIDKKKAAQNVL